MQHPAILQDAVTDVLLRVNLGSVGQTIEFDRTSLALSIDTIAIDRNVSTVTTN